MITRYSRPAMAKIWKLENRFRTILAVEIAVCDAMADLNLIPQQAAKEIRQKADFDLKRIQEIENEVKHDLIAFLTAVGEHVGPASRYMHKGLTSSDVIDTAFALQLIEAANILLEGIDKVCAALKKQAVEHEKTICAGRSHGIHGEPTSFGLKMASHYAAFQRGAERLKNAKKDIGTCALSGAVGTYATINPQVEVKVAKKLGLKVETISTQIIPRDRHAFFFSVVAGIAASIENLATEIRHLQRTEVREVEESFTQGQKGSSAMPHKKNPVLSENLTGLSRIIRSTVTPALEDVTLWHERDISHSSVERVIAPQATIILDFALHRLGDLIEDLVVYPKRMMKNLQSQRGLVFSQNILLALIDAGMSREESYKIVQGHAMDVWENEKTTFDKQLLKDKMITQILPEKKIKEIMKYESYLQHTNVIYSRVFSTSDKGNND